MRMIQTSILRNRIAGLGKNRKTAVFPKLVFAIRDGLNHKFGDANYDIKQLALECASKRMYPDILNYDQVVKVTGSFKTPMGCRSFLGVYEENGEQIHDGRNNLGVISLNLPRIALEAKGDDARFWSLLDDRLLLAKRALMTRIARLEGVKARVAPILYMEGACGVRLKADDDVSEIFKNGRASISLGYIGIHETINALSGNQHTFTTAKRCVKKPSPSLAVCVKPLTTGKTKPATRSACTVRQVKTCVTASAAWIPRRIRYRPWRDRQRLLRSNPPGR